ncbi:MAG: response regulator transcription factor [Gemmatimonadota bacterium]
MNNPSRIRILMVDDSEVVRVGLAAVLSQDPALEIVGQAATSEAAVAAADRLTPDVILMDVRIPEAGGIEACRLIVEAHPYIRVLFLSAFADEEIVRAAILVGGRGYLLKEIDTRSLIDSIKKVAVGDSILDPAITSGVLDWVMRSVVTPGQPDPDQLSPQEQRIVALVAQGKTNKEIAIAMDLSPKTVKNYLHNVFEKLGIQRRSQAAVLHAQGKLGK